MPNSIILKTSTRTVTCYPSGRAVFRFSYTTTFGENSAGYERVFQSQREAVEQAEQWVMMPTPKDM